MKRKAIIPLVLGLGIGLLAVKFGIDAIRQAQASNEAKATVSVVRAKLDIPAHEEIRADMLELIEVQDSLLVPAIDRIEAVDKAAGRVTAKAIPRSSPVLLSMLAPEGTQPGIVGQIPPGYRAVSVKIDEVTGVAYQLRPGAWVDVTVVMDVATGARGSRSRQKETVAQVILQRVEVVAVGYGGSTEAESGAKKVKPAKSATLLVKEEEVPKLHLAQTKGKITLSMRGQEDSDSTTPAIAYSGDIGATDEPPSVDAPVPMPQLFAASAEPEPLPPHQVLVFHRSSKAGDDTAIEQVVFENVDSTKLVGISQGAPTRTAATMRALEDKRTPGRSGAVQGRKSGAVSSTPKSGDDTINLPSGTGN